MRTITYRTVLEQVSQATGTCEGTYDNGAITQAIIDAHGLVDIETLNHDEFWTTVLDHAAPAVPSDPFAGIDESTEFDATRPAVS